MNKSIIIYLVCSMVLSYPCSLFAQGRIIRPSKQQTEQTVVPKQESSQKVSGSKESLSQKFHWDEYGICQDQIVDLGLSVKWAGWNVGSSAPEQPGQIFGWGDPSGEETVADESKYPTKNPPKSICGDPRYDMATVNWGKPWRLPTQKEFNELKEQCTWIPFQYKGSKGAKVTGLNGNTMFIPISKMRKIISNDLKTFFWGDETNYYSGDISSFSQSVGTGSAYYLRISLELKDFVLIYLYETSRRFEAYPVRAVYAQ